MVDSMMVARMRWSLWSSEAQRYYWLTVRFDKETGKLLTPPRNIAKHSAFGWGTWNNGKKIKSQYGDCWVVDTPSHGGFILVTQQRISALDEWVEEFSYRFHDLSHNGYSLYVYQFEEDCDWAVLLYLDPVAMDSWLTYRNSWSSNPTWPMTVKQYLEREILPTLKRWNEEILSEADAA